ncbi:GntR family transcriptional regulator [Blastococcus sp. SYSU DS0617]
MSDEAVLVEIDPLSPVPIYQQLRDRLIEAIASGRLVRGQPLSSVRTVARAFGINVATVAKAYDGLRQDGLVATTSKSGSVVVRDPTSGPPDAAFVADWTARARTLLAEAVARGMPPAEAVGICDRLAASFTSPAAAGASPEGAP